MGNHKILFNTGLSPAWDEPPFKKWIENDNLCYCDTLGALGDANLLSHSHVHCVNVSTGRTSQAFVRLSEKVLANIEAFDTPTPYTNTIGEHKFLNVLTTDHPAISDVLL